MQNDIETRKVELEERRLTEETRLKEMELRFQREQWEATRNVPSGWSRQLLSPVGVAVLTAFVGFAGTLATMWQNVRVERQKQEFSACCTWA